MVKRNTTVCSIWDKGYRYGFNGMEHDKDIGSDDYTTEFRQLDTRLGRWFSIDPLFKNYPNQSPYCTFDNMPILIKDPNGLEGVPSVKQQMKQEKRYKNLKKRLEKRFGKETDKYNFELLRKGSKSRYGGIIETKGTLVGGGKGKNKDLNGGVTVQLGYDLRKSEVLETTIVGDKGDNKTAPMGVSGTAGGEDKTLTLTNVKDGEKIFIEANTYSGFRTEVYINGILQIAFADSYQKPLEPGEDQHDAGHQHHKDLKSLVINTGSTTPTTVVITFKSIFTDVGATVHKAVYGWPADLSRITLARALPASKSPSVQ